MSVLHRQEDEAHVFTVTVDEMMHRFEVVFDETTAHVSFEESVGYRGQVYTTPPVDAVWQVLFDSPEWEASVPSSVSYLNRVLNR